MGHAVYTLSDPRAVVLKQYAESLSEEKGLEEEFHLYESVEKIASEAADVSQNVFPNRLCRNVDFYSGFVYSMLGIPDTAVHADFRYFPNFRMVCAPY